MGKGVVHLLGCMWAGKIGSVYAVCYDLCEMDETHEDFIDKASTSESKKSTNVLLFLIR